MPMVNIDGIKTAIKTILDDANTTTATIDLSGGLATRVRNVSKVHPIRIAQQPSRIPCVTITADRKTVEPLTIGVTGQGLRKAVFTLQVIGLCHEPFFTDKNEDQGAENCERLMENIEAILRDNVQLNNNVSWAFPTTVQYDEIRLDEQTNLRAGLMFLECKIHY